jgi:hypothetical protein
VHKAATQVTDNKPEEGKKPRPVPHWKLATAVLDPEKVVVMNQFWGDYKKRLLDGQQGPQEMGACPVRDLVTNWDKLK